MLRMAGAYVYGKPHSLGALEKMFYHDICHETFRTVGTGPAAISCIRCMLYRRRRGSGEPGVRQTFERIGNERDLQI